MRRASQILKNRRTSLFDKDHRAFNTEKEKDHKSPVREGLATINSSDKSSQSSEHRRRRISLKQNKKAGRDLDE